MKINKFHSTIFSLIFFKHSDQCISKLREKIYVLNLKLAKKSKPSSCPKKNEVCIFKW